MDGVFSNYTDLALASRATVLTAAVPEPETWAMFAIGLGALALVARRRAAAPKGRADAEPASAIAH